MAVINQPARIIDIATTIHQYIITVCDTASSGGGGEGTIGRYSCCPRIGLRIRASSVYGKGIGTDEFTVRTIGTSIGNANIQSRPCVAAVVDLAVRRRVCIDENCFWNDADGTDHEAIG